MANHIYTILDGEDFQYGKKILKKDYTSLKKREKKRKKNISFLINA